MANAQTEALTKASALLKAGKVQEADDLIKQALVDAAKAAGEPPPPVEPAPPRSGEAILFDVVKTIASLLGNNPALAPLIVELEAALKPPPAA